MCDGGGMEYMSHNIAMCDVSQGFGLKFLLALYQAHASV